MMTAINGVMLAAGSSLAALIVVKVTIVAALGLAAAWLARRSRAAVRHALLAVTFGATLVLPIASLVAPPVQVTVPVAEVSRAAGPLVVNTTASIPPVTTAADGAPVAPAAPQQSWTFSLSVLLLAGWIVGTAVFLVPVMAGLWQIRSLRRSGLPWLDGQSIAETLALDAGIHRRVEVLLHEALPGPITCGVLDPAIVLPRDAESWTREDLSRAIVHELEHVRRGDSATRCLARAACALYWFHPLAWIAWRKLVLEAERSCDDAVLRRSEATAYADQLVRLAKRLPTAQRSPLLAMASRSDLSARIGAVLDGGQRRGRTGIRALALACAVAVVLVIAMSPLRLVAATQAAPVPTVKAPPFDAVSIRPVDPNIESEKLHEQSGPLRLVAQSQLATSDRAVSAAQAAPQFDVVSIKRSPLDARTSLRPMSGGGITATGVTLKVLLQTAFDLAGFQVIGWPKWVLDEKYEIQAKGGYAGEATTEKTHLMMQSLLADRFQLQYHYETKELPVYVLGVAKNGPKLQESRVEDPGLEMFKQSDGSKGEGIRGSVPVGRLTAQRANMDMLAAFFKGLMGQVVLNRTALAGRYDFKMEWSSDSTPSLVPGVADPVPDDPRPTIFTAVQQQLGLKLEEAKGPVQILVIDRVEKPSEN
ncbi:MAG TPA: M56 family metallopeptidase [Bryobacteraceae bacterium]|jgi:uncharacterized protein (TIGR03435 family)